MPFCATARAVAEHATLALHLPALLALHREPCFLRRLVVAVGLRHGDNRITIVRRNYLSDKPSVRMVFGMFERGQHVMVRLRARDKPVEAEVVLDVGDETVLVDPYGDPSRLARVPRRAVTNGVPPKPKPKVLPPGTVRGRRLPSPSRLACLETEHGWCGTQAQARKLTKAEVIAGVWTLCGTWAESRVLPLTREPTCPECRAQLKMEPM